MSVAYMDGFDWIPESQAGEEWIGVQKSRYRDLGFEMTNDICQSVHLEEAKLIVQKATRRCAVICDDTWMEDEWTGKGAIAVPFLIDEGFEVVDHAGCEEHSLGYVVLKR